MSLRGKTAATSSGIKKSRTPSLLMNLPPELHQAIVQHLPYPDALSLKHSCRYFYSTVYTGIHLKIEWLISRRRLHLKCPNDGTCLLNSDRNFCRGSVRLLMARRRQHGECETRDGGRGCLVLGTKICEWRRSRSPILRLRRWLTTNSGMVVCIFIALVSIILFAIQDEREAYLLELLRLRLVIPNC